MVQLKKVGQPNHVLHAYRQAVGGVVCSTRRGTSRQGLGVVPGKVCRKKSRHKQWCVWCSSNQA